MLFAGVEDFKETEVEDEAEADTEALEELEEELEEDEDDEGVLMWIVGIFPDPQQDSIGQGQDTTGKVIIS